MAKAASILSKEHINIGCVIIDGHNVISSGHNSKSKYHRIQAELDQKYFNDMTAKGCLHAESAALIPLMNRKYDLRDATIYTYREHKDGSTAMSRPCPRCLELIKKCNIKRIRYTTNDGYAFEKLDY